MSSPTSDPGTHRTFGPYRLLGLLGQGAMGEVHQAYDTEHRREVALKLLRADLATEPEYRARFSREAELAARLNDPHVIPIHRYGEFQGRLYLDMRMVVGTDLDELLRAGPLPAAAAVDIVTQIADALDAAHAAGLVHRDVKPSNVLLTTPGADGRRFAYLCDFGIALPVETGNPRLTQTSHVVGTCAYMAPERFTPEHPDRLADVYSLACLLYTALTGQTPFRGDNLLVLIAAHGNPTNRPRPSALRPDLPPALDEVVLRGMAVDKHDRYRSAGELAEAATRALTATAAPGVVGGGTAPGTGAGAAPPTGPVPLATPARRSRLADPWAWLVSAVAGGAAWAVLPGNALAVPIAVGVGAIVLGTAAAGDALLNRRAGPPP